MYELIIPDAVAKDFKHLDRPVMYRTTQYRIAYEILEKDMAILLVMVGKRGDFYGALMRRVGLW